MGLRSFHLLFIAVSVALAAFMAAWAGGQFRQVHEIRFAVTAVVALLAGGGLAVYGAKFQRRTRNM